MNKPIRVILADDHALVLEGLRSLLGPEEDIAVIATATDGERLLAAVTRFAPDVVVADIQMPFMDGVAGLEQMRRRFPQTRILVLTAYSDAETIRAVLGCGADGLLFKTDPPEQTIRAIRQVAEGQMVFPAAARRWLFPAAPPAPETVLSSREEEVLTAVAEGLTNAEVAERLHISENTVKFHLQNIYQRLGVTNRTEASRWYLQEYKS
ncbi:MAG: response regulator transcription factor [Anaerolineales bacterium]|nr:response regulator transcription factor [Anaerolineales bacterium]